MSKEERRREAQRLTKRLRRLRQEKIGLMSDLVASA